MSGLEERRYMAEAAEMATIRMGVMGIGGCGNNTINNLKRSGIEIMTIAVNTDAAVLGKTKADVHILIGESIVRGRGSAGSPELGRQIAEDDMDSMINPLRDKELIVLMAGMGGGTGTGALPAVAEALKERYKDKIVIGVTTLPFSSEGPSRVRNAQWGLSQTLDVCDMTLVQSNDLLKERAGNLPISAAFREMDKVLLDTIYGVVGLQGIVPTPGLVNLDYSNFAALVRASGLGYIGVGREQGTIAAFQTALKANYSNADIRNARGALIYLEGNQTLLRMTDLERIPNILNKEYGISMIFWGIKPNWRVRGLQAMLVATGVKSPLVEQYLRGDEVI